MYIAEFLRTHRSGRVHLKSGAFALIKISGVLPIPIRVSSRHNLPNSEIIKISGISSVGSICFDIQISTGNLKYTTVNKRGSLASIDVIGGCVDQCAIVKECGIAGEVQSSTRGRG